MSVDCPSCSREFETEFALKSHHHQSHGESLAGFPCPVEWCNRSFNARSHRERHLDNHPEKADTVACPSCGTLFVNSSLGSHLDNKNHWPDLEKTTLETIIGLTLGDGYLGGSEGRRPALQLIMTNREFLEWLDTEFGWLSTGVSKHRTASEAAKHAKKVGLEGTTGSERNFEAQYVLRARSHPKFQEIQRRLYTDTGKRIPTDLRLTPVIAKMWYVCDGGLLRHGHRNPALQFSSRNDVDRLDVLAEMFRSEGFEPGAHGDHAIQFGNSEARQLLDWMGSPPPGFDYKWM